MTVPVTADPVVVTPLSPAKIAVNDPSSIVTALATIGAIVANVWPGSTGLPAGSPKTLGLMATALIVTLMFSKHLLSAAAVTASAGAPVTQADLAAHAPAQQQALAKLQEALSETLQALSAPPGAPYPPPAGVPIVEPAAGT